MEFSFLFFVYFFIFEFRKKLYSEKADLKSRSDSTGGGVGPQMDSIYTTPAGFHHQHHPHHHQHHQSRTGSHHGSPEAMKVRMAAMVLQPPTRV